MKLEVALSIGIMIAGVLVGVALLVYATRSSDGDQEETAEQAATRQAAVQLL